MRCWSGLAAFWPVGARQAFEHRPALDLASFGQASRDWLLGHDMVPLDVQSAWDKASQDALNLIAIHASLTEATGLKTLNHPDAQNRHEDSAIHLIRLHGDCHPGNILWTPLDVPSAAGPGPHFVDMDDARTGPAVQDMWMLLSGDRAQRSRQLGALVDGYEQFRDFDRRELALIEPLRTLRLIHYSAWLARRWHDPIFPKNWPHFGSEESWERETVDLEEQALVVARVERGGTVAPPPTAEDEEALTNKDLFWDWDG